MSRLIFGDCMNKTSSIALVVIAMKCTAMYGLPDRKDGPFEKTQIFRCDTGTEICVFFESKVYQGMGAGVSCYPKPKETAK